MSDYIVCPSCNGIGDRGWPPRTCGRCEGVGNIRRPRSFCDAFIEHPSDPHGSTFCKLLAGHDGDHSAHYPAAADA